MKPVCPSPEPLPELPFAQDLRDLHRALAPKSVGCLYAGDMSHVPLDDFLRGGSRVWVVDWRPRRPSEPTGSSLVRRDGEGYACRACEDADGASVCASFAPPPDGDATVCASFVLLEGFPPRCARYAPGALARKVVADGTLGRAACFTTRVEELVARASTYAEALGLAIEECHRCSKMNFALDIPSDSLDLAISVLVPARVADEPFRHLDEVLARRFGSRRSGAKRQVLARLETRVRVDLFRMQMDGHLRELHRVVRKQGGRVYFATEPVTAARATDGWGLEPGIPLVFALIDRYFTFDFGLLPPTAFLRKAQSASGRPQVVQAVVLSPRKRQLWRSSGGLDHDTPREASDESNHLRE